MSATHPRDRFDEVPRTSGRVGAHRAEHPGMRGPVVLAWAAVATVVLVGAGILGFLHLSQQGALPVPSSSTQSPVETTQAPVVDTSYSVLVLNGTGTDGVDQQVADEIVAAGFPESAVATSSSSSTDFPTTTVYYGAAEDEAAARGLADAIGATEVVQSTEYQGQEGAKELTVVVGLDRVSAG